MNRIMANTLDRKMGLGICKELEFTLLCNHEVPNAALDSAACALAQKNMNLNLLVVCAEKTKSMPLVASFFERMSRSGDSSLSHCVRAANQKFLRSTWTPMRLRLKWAMQLIREVFSENEVPFLILRGVPFGDRFYLVPEHRVCSDVDILVPERHLLTACQLLQSIGFSRRRAPEIGDALVRYVGQIELEHEKLRVNVDLNCRLTANGQTGGISRNMTLIWNRSTQIGKSEYSLSVEDTLIHIIRHAAQGHNLGYEIVQCCADVECVLRKHSVLDWDYLAAEVRNCGCHNAARVFTKIFGSVYQSEYGPVLEQCLTVDRPNSGGEKMHPPVSSAGADEFSLELCLRVCFGFHTSVRFRKNAFLNTVVVENVKLLWRIWSADNQFFILKMLRVVAFPTRDEVVLLTTDLGTKHMLVRRYLLYLFFGTILAPSLILGLVARSVLPLQSHKRLQLKS